MMTRTVLINILLALAWGAVTGSFSLLNLVFGFVIAAIALWIIREQFHTQAYIKKAWRVTSLILVFLKDLTVSAFRVAVIVLAPTRRYQPGFIAFPLTTDRAPEIAILANMITLTPGTLSVDVSDDKSTLFIHCIDVPDTEALKRDIAEGFERKIMEAMR
jgi:multicomponent Na+:H+ antiporter subunit E